MLKTCQRHSGLPEHLIGDMIADDELQKGKEGILIFMQLESDVVIEGRVEAVVVYNGSSEPGLSLLDIPGLSAAENERAKQFKLDEGRHPSRGILSSSQLRAADYTNRPSLRFSTLR